MNKLIKLIMAATLGTTATCFAGCSTLSPNAKRSTIVYKFGVQYLHGRI